jgi:hypothetical protein
MLDEKLYSDWTSAFSPTSRYKGSWEKGATIHFIGTDEQGNEGGMVSRIRENTPGRFVSIEHLGMLKDGRPVTGGEEVDAWSGALENYTFREENGKTRLLVDAETTLEYVDYFNTTWPKALERLKAICEKS